MRYVKTYIKTIIIYFISLHTPTVNLLKTLPNLFNINQKRTT